MKNESGNALWFILLAVALLAALAVTITRTSSSTEQEGDIERQRVMASDLMRFAASIEQTIERMRLNGMSENEISFEIAALPGYANPRCSSDSCKIFDAEGGGISLKTPPTFANDGSAWFFTGANSVEGLVNDGTGATSSDDNELLMILPGVTEGLCGRINAELGIAGIPQDTTKADVATKFAGTFTNGQVIENMAGKRTGCFQGNQDDGGADISAKYYFYHALIAR
ncbi:MAG TPA: hypothetical protein VIG74_06295 [Alphaproteobacteria bacterium]